MRKKNKIIERIVDVGIAFTIPVFIITYMFKDSLVRYIIRLLLFIAGVIAIVGIIEGFDFF